MCGRGMRQVMRCLVPFTVAIYIFKIKETPSMIVSLFNNLLRKHYCDFRPLLPVTKEKIKMFSILLFIFFLNKYK